MIKKITRMFSALIMILLLIVLYYLWLHTYSKYLSEKKKYVEEEYKGAGTEENPYQISSGSDLISMRERIKNGEHFSGVYFIQVKDIDLEGINWEPIGEVGTDSFFEGTYNGGGHIISNIHIPNDSETIVYGGLFGQFNGKIMNLGIQSGEIYGDYCGSIASIGISEAAIIVNCFNRAGIFGEKSSGGIVYSTKGSVANCWSECKLSGDRVGQIYSGDCSKCINCVGLSLFGIKDIECIKVKGIDCIETIDYLNRSIESSASNIGINARWLNKWELIDGDAQLGIKAMLSLRQENVLKITLCIFASLMLIAACMIPEKETKRTVIRKYGNIEYLRFVFALEIIILHASQTSNGSSVRVLSGGYLGVSFFFFISGFFLASSIALKKTQKIKQDAFVKCFGYFIARVKKIYPYLLVSTTIGYIIFILARKIVFVDMIEMLPLVFGDLLMLQCLGYNAFSATGTVWFLSALFVSIWILYPVICYFYETGISIYAVFIGIFLVGCIYYNNAGSMLAVPTLQINGLINGGVLWSIAMMSMGTGAFLLQDVLKKYDTKCINRKLLTLLEIALYTAILLYMTKYPMIIKRNCDDIMVIFTAMATTLSLSGKTYTAYLCDNVLARRLGKYSMPLFLNHAYWALNIDYFATWRGYLLTVPQKIEIVLMLSILSSFVVIKVVDVISWLIIKYRGQSLIQIDKTA